MSPTYNGDASAQIALEQFTRILEAGDLSSLEALGFFSRLLDRFSRIINNTIANLKSLSVTFKRSELRFYHETHPRELADFMRNARLDPNLYVPIPTGMRVSYRNAVETLTQLYTTLQIKTTVAALRSYIHLSDHDRLAQTLRVAQSIDHLTQEATQTALQRVFTSDHTLEVPLSQVIASRDDLKTVNAGILTFESNFNSVEGIVTQLQDIERGLDAQISNLEAQTKRNPQEIHDLLRLVRTASVQFDMLGVLLHEMQRVEHNFVHVLKKLLTAHRQAG